MDSELVFKQLFRMDGSFVIVFNGVEVFDGNMDIHGSAGLEAVEEAVNNIIKVLGELKELDNVVEVHEMECDDLGEDFDDV